MGTDPHYLLDLYEPISLADMESGASLQTRVDSKYIILWSVFEDWQQDLNKSHRVLDINGERIFTYDTQYFDTPTLGLFRDHIQGRRKRFKVRTRQYIETGLSFLEIKFKGNRGETIKKRIPYDPEALNTLDDRATDYIESCLKETYGDELTEPLVPSIKTRYRRFTLAANDYSERITCDFDLSFVRNGVAQAGLNERFVLVEMKTANGRGMSERALWKLGERPIGSSKYCVGVSLSWVEMKANKLHHQIRTFYG